MNEKRSFTASEARRIRELLVQKTHADRDTQKKLRGQLRRLGFRISEFSGAYDGFTATDFDDLVGRETIDIVDDGEDEPPPTVRRRSGGRGGSDEHYVVDLCDEVLGEHALRQHRFSFLRGDADTPLPVDAYYPNLKLAVEYRERQHTESVPFFDKRKTVSGVPRGLQRRRYDQRRRDVLPAHGIRLVEFDVHDFAARGARLLRNRDEDLKVVRRKLGEAVDRPKTTAGSETE